MILYQGSKQWRSSDTDDKKKSVCLLSRHVGQKHSNEMPHWRNGPRTSSRAQSRSTHKGRYAHTSVGSHVAYSRVHTQTL